MVTVQQIQEGAARYLDAEMLPKIGGWKKWVAGAAAVEYLLKIETIVERMRKNPAISMLGVIGEDNSVDVERIRDAFVRQARASGDVSFDIPLLGTMKIGEKDIDTLYRYIMGGM